MTQQHDFGRHLVHVVRRLKAEYEESKAYGHSSGRGDRREDILREWLRKLLPSAIKLSKGEIADHTGRRTAEFDLILHVCRRARGTATIR